LPHGPAASPWRTLASDYRNDYFSGARWRRLGIAFGVAGAMANTHIDQGIRDRHQQHERSAGTDRLAGNFKKLGEAKYLIPLSLPAQDLSGGSHPGERDHASHWRAFQDTNGVSGHACIGAVPSLTLAQMSHSRIVRDGAYAATDAIDDTDAHRKAQPRTSAYRPGAAARWSSWTVSGSASAGSRRPTRSGLQVIQPKGR